MYIHCDSGWMEYVYTLRLWVDGICIYIATLGGLIDHVYTLRLWVD